MVETLGLAQSLIQIPKNILNILNPDAQADKIGGNARACLLLLVQLAVCGSRWMNGQAFCIADIRQMAEEFEAFDKPLPCVSPTFYAKTQNCTSAFR